MTDRPIIFSTAMVKALIAGSKSQTRRVIKPQPEDVGLWMAEGNKPRYAVGDRLWVREAWGYDWYDDGQTRSWKRVVYRADDGAKPSDNGDEVPWRPSIHLARRDSRLTLTVTSVRVQRLRSISEEDAKAEGLFKVDSPGDEANGCWTWDGAPDFVECWSAQSAYLKLWDLLHGDGARDANPFVAALTFTVEQRNIDELKAAA